jgi:hypothetical protein
VKLWLGFSRVCERGNPGSRPRVRQTMSYRAHALVFEGRF